VARRIRIPWLVDLTRVDQPAEIRSLVAEPALDRRFAARGPLVNRMVTGRIRRWFRLDDEPLPALAPRGDRQRVERQRSLHEALQPGTGKVLWSDGQLALLAGYVRGRAQHADMAIAVQEIVGRRFDPGYVADRASWAAAQMIEAFGEARPRSLPRDLWWMASGKLRRARELLADRAGRDRHALHGTAIGVHGIVHALERMRDLHAPDAGRSIDGRTAVARCLHAPRRVLRTVEAPLATPTTPTALRPGSLVLLELGAAGSRAPDPDIVFMHGHWSFCPAEQFVPALLAAAWREAGRSGEGPP